MSVILKVSFGLWTRSLTITWRHVRNTNSQALLRRSPLSQKLWGWGPAICVLTSTPGDSDADRLLYMDANRLKPFPLPGLLLWHPLASAVSLECRLCFVADGRVGGRGWWTECCTWFWRPGLTALSLPGCVTLGQSVGLSVFSSMKQSDYLPHRLVYTELNTKYMQKWPTASGT